MPKIIILPNKEKCPDGVTFEANKGDNLIEVSLKNGIDIEHACEKVCACTTCHIYVREGFSSLEDATELEDDQLDKAWGLEPDSRLSCQTIIGEKDLVVEIPKYTLNLVSENH